MDRRLLDSATDRLASRMDKDVSSLLLGSLRHNAPANIVKEAKASLQNPSRPFTPGDAGRKLFSESEYANRPPTAGLMPRRPLGTPADPFSSGPGSSGNSFSGPNVFVNTSGGSFTAGEALLPPLSGTPPAASARTALPPLQHLSLKPSVDAQSRAAASAVSAAQILTVNRDTADLQRPPTAAPGPSALQRFRRAQSGLDRPPTQEGTPTSTLQAPKQSSLLQSRSINNRQTIDSHPPMPSPEAPLPPRPVSSRPPLPSSAAANSLLAASLVQRQGSLTQDTGTRAEPSGPANSLPSAPARPSGSAGSSRPSSRETAAVSKPSPMPLIGPGPGVGVVRPGSRGASGEVAGLPEGLSEDFEGWREEVENVLVALGTQEALTPTSQLSSEAAGPPSSSSPLAHFARLASHLLALVEVGARKAPEEWGQWLGCLSTVYETEEGGSLTLGECLEEHADRLQDCPSTSLSLKGSALLLRVLPFLPPSPSQNQALLRTARTLFARSKDQQADPLFRKEGALPAMCDLLKHFARQEEQQGDSTLAEPSPPLDVVIYLTGALKNTSQDASNQRALFKLGGGELTVRLLRVVRARAHRHLTGQEADLPVDRWAQLAVQVAAVMRNLAQSASQARAFASKGGGYDALPELLWLARSLHAHRELVLNVTRVLSKLCLVDECLQDLGEGAEGPRTLFSLMKDYEAHPQILLRSAFVLALCTAAFGPARAAFRDQGEHVTSTLAGILDRWASGRHDASLTAQGDEDAAAERKAGSEGAASLSKGPAPSVLRAELLVKVVRVAANLAIDPALGPVIAADPRISAHLVRLLAEFSLEDHEELALNLACAATNLTFYVGPANVLLTQHAPALVASALPMLTSDNEEAVVEAARTLGNLSRKHEARVEMVRRRAVEALIYLLDHHHRDVVYSATGAMVNVVGDGACREAVEAAGCAGRLIDVLERSGSAFATSPGGTPQLDWPLAMAACKALYNLLADEDGGLLTPSELEQLAGFLAVLPSLDGAPRDVASVATRLLEAVQLRGSGVLAEEPVDSASNPWSTGYGGEEGGELEPLPFSEPAPGDESGFLHDD